MTITKRGSQLREPLAETEYRIARSWPDVDKGSVVLVDETGKCELWAKREDYCGYVIVINGHGYEFIRNL